MKLGSIFNKLFKVLEIMLVVVSIILLSIYSYILISSKLYPEKIPAIFGYKPFIVMSGSMTPIINKGDLIIVKKVDCNLLKTGDIIAFKTEDNKVITHKINNVDIQNGQKKYITKGDNNNSIDEGYVLAKDIEGIYVSKISGLGNILLFIRKPLGLIVCLLSIGVIGLVYTLIKVTKK